MLDAATIFLSAFLLFQVQLILAKALLPWFGGTPAVWTTCMMFFQVLLLGGYAYAHGLAARLTSRRQAMVHMAVVAISALSLAAFAWMWACPLLPSVDWRPDDPTQPIQSLAWLLGLAVGLPFFVLSATSPLLQRWIADRAGQPPYRLYAVSNAGSLAGLLSYPVLVEPFLNLHQQAWIWAGAFVLFAAGVIAAAVRTLKPAPAPK